MLLEVGMSDYEDAIQMVARRMVLAVSRAGLDENGHVQWEDGFRIATEDLRKAVGEILAAMVEAEDAEEAGEGLN
jgi:hypothetical protein